MEGLAAAEAEVADSMKPQENVIVASENFSGPSEAAGTSVWASLISLDTERIVARWPGLARSFSFLLLKWQFFFFLRVS
jgi:hypothetical protein